MGDEFFGGLHSGAFDYRDLTGRRGPAPSSGAGAGPDEAVEGTPGSVDSG